MGKTFHHCAPVCILSHPGMLTDASIAGGNLNGADERVLGK